jgi:hypothetical protein
MSNFTNRELNMSEGKQEPREWLTPEWLLDVLQEYAPKQAEKIGWQTLKQIAEALVLPAARQANQPQPSVEEISEVAHSIAKDYLHSRVVYSEEPLVNLIVNRVDRLIRHSQPQEKAQPESGEIWPECRVFYELMQAYRHTPIVEVIGVSIAYNVVKNWLNAERMRFEKAAFQRGQQAMAENVAQHIPYFDTKTLELFCKCGRPIALWSEHIRSLASDQKDK